MTFQNGLPSFALVSVSVSLKEDASELKENFDRTPSKYEGYIPENTVPTMLSMIRAMVTLNTTRQLSYLRFFSESCPSKG